MYIHRNISRERERDYTYIYIYNVTARAARCDGTELCLG